MNKNMKTYKSLIEYMLSLIHIWLAAMVSLVSGEKSFQELKKITNASDGNLGAQLLKLENEKYIESAKSFVNRKPRTTYKITELGKAMLKEYVDL